MSLLSKIFYCDITISSHHISLNLQNIWIQKNTNEIWSFARNQKWIFIAKNVTFVRLINMIWKNIAQPKNIKKLVSRKKKLVSRKKKLVRRKSIMKISTILKLPTIPVWVWENVQISPRFVHSSKKM